MTSVASHSERPFEMAYRMSSSTSKGILSTGQGRLHMQPNPPARSTEMDVLLSFNMALLSRRLFMLAGNLNFRPQ